MHSLAARHGITVHNPTGLKDAHAQETFAAHGADAAVVAAYGLLLPKPVLDAPKLGCLNVHPSKLPRWRGAAPIQRSIMAGDTETACTIMRMNAGLDTGDIVLARDFAIPPDMDAGALHDRMAAMAGPLVLEALAGLAAKTLAPTPQPAEGVTYAAKITKEECLLDWTQPGQAMLLRIRGLSPAPGAYFVHAGERIKVLKAEFKPESVSSPPGEVTDAHLGIACADGVLRPLVLQRAGRNPLVREAFLRGHPIPEGVRLASV